jgi:hypothetical protein
MKLSTLATRTALGFALLYAAAPLVQAQEQRAVVQITGSIPFMSGGIGKDQQTYLRQAGKDFNLRFEFSERNDNEFVAGTELSITDMQGHPVFALADADPIVNVELPDGQYRVTADYQGQHETRLVTVRRKAGQDVYFHWKGNARVEPTSTVDTSAEVD